LALDDLTATAGAAIIEPGDREVTPKKQADLAAGACRSFKCVTLILPAVKTSNHNT
jgi:hypothetical protein